MILCIDVGPAMDVAPPTGDQETPLEASLRIAERIVTQKVVGFTLDFCLH